MARPVEKISITFTSVKSLHWFQKSLVGWFRLQVTRAIKWLHFQQNPTTPTPIPMLINPKILHSSDETGTFLFSHLDSPLLLLEKPIIKSFYLWNQFNLPFLLCNYELHCFSISIEKKQNTMFVPTKKDIRKVLLSVQIYAWHYLQIAFMHYYVSFHFHPKKQQQFH